MTGSATQAALDHGYVDIGDKTIVTSGIKLSEGDTSSIRVYTMHA